MTSGRDRTPFFGRARERELLLADIAGGGALLTITGPAGMGKTRLAQQVARGVLESFADDGGAWFCSLAACHNAADVEAAVARLLGIPQQHGEALAGALANRGRLLLVLDNLDWVTTQVAGIFRTWLDRCPSLQMVTTSIVPLEMEEAVRYELGPLEADDAVALYLERAHRASAGRLAEGEQSAVTELVGRLDRIPLAIELAAARVRLFPPRALVSRLGERFDLLRSEAPGRHGSLLKALRFTWELLSRTEQELLARASVFEGGFAYDAAVAVLGDDANPGETLDLLDGLRSKALLQLLDSPEPRLELFESVREFGARELSRLGLESDAQRRHTTYFLECAGAYVPLLEGPNAGEAIAWLKAERENLTAILLRSVEASPQDAAQAGIVLYPVFKMEGCPRSAVRLLELGLQAARTSGDPLLIIRAISIYQSSNPYTAEGDEALEEGLRLARLHRFPKEESGLLVKKAWIQIRRGELEEAAVLMDRAIELARGVGDPISEVSALIYRGEVELARLALDEAERFGLEAMAILRGHDLPQLEGFCLFSLALVWGSQGRFAEARRALLESLERRKELGDQALEAAALMNLGMLEFAAGRLDHAKERSLEALAMLRLHGNRQGEAITTATLGQIALESWELELAEQKLVDAMSYFRQSGARRLEGLSLLHLAAVEARLGRSQGGARRTLEAARGRLEEAGDRGSLPVADVIAGVVELAEARAQPAHRAPLVAKARERLVQAMTSKVPSSFLLEAIRLLQDDIERWNRDFPESKAEPQPWLVGPEGAWFEQPGSARVNLRRRVAIRRMFAALVEKRISAPGESVGPHRLFEVGWPGVQIPPEYATQRVYLGIWTLREMGLTDFLLHQTDGYLLDPNLVLHLQEE